MTGRLLGPLLLGAWLAQPLAAQSVRISVLSLFRPSVIEVSGRRFTAADLPVTLPPGLWRVSVPGRIERTYNGSLEIRAVPGALRIVVDMDIETAVAAATAAESAPGATAEALRSQAVASRSFYTAARGRHDDFDFCDTTHCQFLRQPTAASRQAGLATRGLLLRFGDLVLPALFTASCSGQTLSAAEAGLNSSPYAFPPAVCDGCLRHPQTWTRTLSEADAAALARHGEAARLELVRRLGWDAVPSNTFSVERRGQVVLLRGRGRGHGVGLCQTGAAAMARRGASFRQILAHYFPGAAVW